MEYNFYLDRKITVWERDTFAIEADTQDEAIEKMKLLMERYDYQEQDGWVKNEQLLDTVNSLSPERNDYDATLMLLDAETQAELATNKPHPVVAYAAQNNFHCTDPDNLQYVRFEGANCFTFIEANPRWAIDPKENPYIEGVIDMTKYTKDQIWSYAQAYYSLAEFEEMYQAGTFGVLAECIFETERWLTN